MTYFYNKSDEKKEAIGVVNINDSRLEAAKYFAKIKRLPLKDFLKIFSVEKNIKK